MTSLTADHAEPTAWQRVELARHVERPYSLDYVRRLAGTFYELHGDRLVGDDAALVAGIGRWHDLSVMFFGQQKGRSLRERISRNYGMLHPEGYRKVIRLSELASRFGFPVVCLVDTPGAFPGAGAEERGIASAIASAILTWFHVRTPVVAAIIGEGGSGGALGLAIADRVLILENAIYSVASPEACASIVWRDPSRKSEAAEQLRLTAADLLELGVVDEVVPEPPGGAHLDHDGAAAILGAAIHRHLRELLELDRDVLLRQRLARYRRIGGA